METPEEKLTDAELALFNEYRTLLEAASQEEAQHFEALQALSEWQAWNQANEAKNKLDAAERALHTTLAKRYRMNPRQDTINSDSGEIKRGASGTRLNPSSRAR